MMGFDMGCDETRDAWWVLDNAAAGHAPTCAHAGGGDCTCPKGLRTFYVVTAVVEGRSIPIDLCEDEERAVRVARTARKVMVGVRCRRLRGHTSDDMFDDMIETIRESIRSEK